MAEKLKSINLRPAKHGLANAKMTGSEKTIKNLVRVGISEPAEEIIISVVKFT